jgi:short-subunit dehydrogenase
VLVTVPQRYDGVGPSRPDDRARHDDPVQLHGAVAVVTGASHGIGNTTARLLAARGATVVAAGLNEPELTELTRTIGGSFVCTDVRDPSHADGLVRHTLEHHGRLDLVVANAGVGHAGRVATMTADRIGDLVDINARAPMLLARAALPIMLEQRRGALVFISSIAGQVPVPNEAVYSATKAAVEAFADALREEVRGSGVTVSTVAPGVVATRFFADRGAPYERRFPRPISPERIATAVVRAAERGVPHAIVPRWLGVAPRVRGVAPRTFRALARLFG